MVEDEDCFWENKDMKRIIYLNLYFSRDWFNIECRGYFFLEDIKKEEGINK